MDYTTALSKGRSLLHLLHATDSSADNLVGPSTPESPFLTPSDLSAWGYSINDYNYTPCANLDNIQKPLGIDTTQNIAIGHSHLDSCIKDGIYVPVTWAKFNTVVNGPGGMLVAIDNESPTALARLRSKRHTAVAAPLPDLRYWSDVAFLQWDTVTKGAADLRYVVRFGITNASALAVVSRLLERDGKCEIKRQWTTDWPDVTWRDEEAVAALLGTPNGSGVARLLIHHKRQLGHKVVEEVRLVGFKGVVPAIAGEPSLVFKIGDGAGAGVVRNGEEKNGKGMGVGVGNGQMYHEDMGFWIFDSE